MKLFLLMVIALLVVAAMILVMDAYALEISEDLTIVSDSEVPDGVIFWQTYEDGSGRWEVNFDGQTYGLIDCQWVRIIDMGGK